MLLVLSICIQACGKVSYVYPEVGTGQASSSSGLPDSSIPADTSVPVPPTPTTPALTVAPTPAANTAVRIAAAATTPYTDSLGQIWSPDRYYTGGNVTAFPAINVSGTNDSPLFSRERWGSMHYAIPVPNGNYMVRLYFAETFAQITRPGLRVFDINIEAAPRFTGLDIFAEAGGQNRAIIKTALVVVQDGVLDIDFIARIEDPKINAIEVLSLPLN